jgi:sulfhydrogenase subunit beta (sulfur reductase)
MYKLYPNELERLFGVLQSQGYQVFGPRESEHGPVLGALDRPDDMARRWVADPQPGMMTWRRQDHGAFFSYTTLLESWKSVVFPAVEALWAAPDGSAPSLVEYEPERLALLGLHACDLRALEILDRVFLAGSSPDAHYRRRRENLFIVGVECQHAAATCFCAAMESGPRIEKGADWVLTEICNEQAHYFLLRAQSDRGRKWLDAELLSTARPEEIRIAEQGLQQVTQQTAWQGAKNLPERALADHYRHSHWDDVAQRCLACGNCTAVCPTCFCFDMLHHGDVVCETSCGRRWSSCFNAEHSYIHGGSVRSGIASRYRQWLMHKLVTWQEQFNINGCVGCGRCISACPAAIDLRREAEALFSPDKEAVHGET